MDTDLPETLFGSRYRLGELLGVGGSASVFAADDVGAGTGEAARVALKILHPHLCVTDAARAAFFREARQAQALRHHNIAAVHGHGLHESGGVTMAWIALDLVEGGSVADRIAERGPFDAHDAAAVLDGVLAALGAAHAAGLVHRDVSPANVLLAAEARPGETLSARVRLVDFGLADVTARAAVGHDVLRAETADLDPHDPDAPDPDPREPGVIGNAHYMSPEQALGRPVRASGDLYQAGALLYFLLTGLPPYPRDTAAQVLEAQVSAPPPVPSALAPGARSLDRVVTRAMTKTPVRRYRDAGEFRAAVAAAVPGAGAALATGPGASAHEAPEEQAGESATRVLGSGVAGRLDYLTEPSPSADETAPRAVGGAGGAAALGVVVVIAVLAVWGVLAASAGPRDDRVAAEQSATPTPTPSVPTLVPEPVPSAPAAAPPPVETAVPTLFGTLGEAEATLRAAGLALGAVQRLESAEPVDRLLGQGVPAGQNVPAGSAIDLTVASGTNTVPAVTGLPAGSATALLESAGFLVRTSGSTAPTATATGTQPGQGTILRVGVTVVLLLGAPAPDPAPSPTAPAPDEPPVGDLP